MSSSKSKTIPLLGELKSGVNGGFVTDIKQVRGGSGTINVVRLSSDNQYIIFYHDMTEICRIEANKLVATGLLTGVELKENFLEMKFNLNGTERTVSVPLSQIFSPGDYYTKTEVDKLIDNKQMFFVFTQHDIDKGIHDKYIKKGQKCISIKIKFNAKTATPILYDETESDASYHLNNFKLI